MAYPYVVVIGNICAGKSTFIQRFSDGYPDWYSLPELLTESHRSTLRGPDTYSLYASFFADFYIDRHLFSRSIPGPMIQESCLESSSLFPQVYYENNCISKEKYTSLEMKYSKSIRELPRPDYYIYLYAPQETLLARAEVRKEPARSVSRLLLPAMQRRLDDWVETHVQPDRYFKVDTQDLNSGLFDTILSKVQALRKRPENPA
jgi:deoxyadenosine/deoxycytidine kinase